MLWINVWISGEQWDKGRKGAEDMLKGAEVV